MKIFPVKVFAFSLIAVASLTDVRAAVSISVNTVASGGDNGAAKYVSSSGGDLALGDLVRVGYFSFGSSPSAAQEDILTGNDFAAIDALFTPLGDENLAAGTGNGSVVISNPLFSTQTSGVRGSITDVDAAGAVPTTRLFLWVFNAPTTGAADEWGIFTSSNSLWSVNNSLSSPSLTSNNITLSYTPDGKLESGSLLDGNGNLRLAPIPEPSVSLLAGIGVVGLILRRRRS